MLTLENGRTHPIVAPQIAERRFAQRVVTRQQFLDPAWHKTRHRRHRRDRMALRQKPDRLVVPRRARVLTGSITSRQIFDAQVVFDMGHGSPPRFMAAHANRFDPKRESALPESFTRKPYDRCTVRKTTGSDGSSNLRFHPALA